MELRLPYGRNSRKLLLPEHFSCDTLEPARRPPLPFPADAVRQAIRRPIGTPALRDMVRPGQSVVIVVNDVTRLVHSELFLPVLVEELNAAGIPDSQICIVFALGLHRRHTPEEQRRIVGLELAARLQMVDHDGFDPANLVSIGHTSRGNQVWVNRRVREADFVILTGEIIYHLLAGYSGGRKGLVPGVAGAETVTFNHRMFSHPGCGIGALNGNPIHEDLMEACRLFEPQFILNVILHPQGGFFCVVAGHYEAAHREGCRAVDELYQVDASIYDLVIASAGGYPLDIDLRQAHKGLENAARVLRPGGSLLFLAECPDGSGSKAIDDWVTRFSSSAEMEAEFQRNFVVGGHKAFWIVRLGERKRLYFHSSLPDDFARRCKLIPTPDPQEALNDILTRLPTGVRIACIPQSGLTLPRVSSADEKSPSAEREWNHVRDYA